MLVRDNESDGHKKDAGTVVEMITKSFIYGQGVRGVEL